MIKWPVIFPLLLLLLPGMAAAAAGLTPRQAKSWLNETKHVHIVDIRPAERYMTGTLKGALHLSFAAFRAMQAEPEAHVLLIADQVDERQLPTGYAELRILQGTPELWHGAGLPVVRVKVSKPAFVIPRGLCEMNEPADEHEAEVVEEAWK